MFTIIHNPRCSKSRQTLELLQKHTDKIKIIDYLAGELTPELLDKVISALRLAPKDILRTKEDKFKQLKIDLDDDKAVKKAILKHPKILERPIVLKGSQAIIGRPPENVEKLFN